MSRAPAVDLPEDHRGLVLTILAAHLPRGTKAWVFGSRATGRARRYSDLDLAIDAGRPLTLDEIALLTEAKAIYPTGSISSTGASSTTAGGAQSPPSAYR